jgi:periplasmic divalent cation tolerance protein
MSTDDALLVFCTCPDRETAERLARTAVAARLAACVNLLPGVLSIYHWAGALESAEEILLIAKTSAAAYPGLEASWRADHPYELPEIIAVPVCSGLPAYLQWIAASVNA